MAILVSGLPWCSDGKESTFNVGDLRSVPGLGRSLKKGTAAHSSILAWRIPWTVEPGRLQSMGSQKIRHNWVTFTLLSLIRKLRSLLVIQISQILSHMAIRGITSSFTHSVSLIQFSRSVVSDSLWPHEPQHARPPCPSPTPGVYSNSCPLSRWCHPTISSSVVPFSRLQPFPASGSFPMTQLFASGGQSKCLIL